MSNNSRLVYSTEHGRLDKSESGKKSRRNKKTQQKPAQTIKNPAKQGVRIRREVKGRGGKCVSVVSGLALPENETKALLKRLKGRLGCGGAVKNGDIEIQGDHRERILQLLESEGIRAKLAGG